MMHISMYKNYVGFENELIEGSNIKNIYFNNDDYESFNFYNYYSDYKKVIDMYGINFRGNNDRTVLIWAYETGKIKIVKLLLKVDGIDVNVQNHSGVTVLIWACFSENIEIIKLLLKVKNIDVSLRANNSGITALEIAYRYKNTEIIELLENFNKHH